MNLVSQHIGGRINLVHFSFKVSTYSIINRVEPFHIINVFLFLRWFNQVIFLLGATIAALPLIRADNFFYILLVIKIIIPIYK